MAKIKANAKWIENVRLVVDNTRSHSVVCDMQQASGGGDTGPTALELALMSLAGCAVTIYADVAKKSGVTLSKLEVTAKAEKFADSPKLSGVNMKIHVEGRQEKNYWKQCGEKQKQTAQYCSYIKTQYL